MISDAQLHHYICIYRDCGAISLISIQTASRQWIPIVVASLPSLPLWPLPLQCGCNRWLLERFVLLFDASSQFKIDAWAQKNPTGHPPPLPKGFMHSLHNGIGASFKIKVYFIIMWMKSLWSTIKRMQCIILLNLNECYLLFVIISIIILSLFCLNPTDLSTSRRQIRYETTTNQVQCELKWFLTTSKWIWISGNFTNEQYKMDMQQ